MEWALFRLTAEKMRTPPLAGFSVRIAGRVMTQSSWLPLTVASIFALSGVAPRMKFASRILT